MSTTVDAADAWTLYWDSYKLDEFRDDLIMLYLPFVESVAARIQKGLPRAYSLDQAKSDAAVALIGSIAKYEYGHNATFETFIGPRIFGAIMDSLRLQDMLTRGARAAGCTVSSLDAPVLIEEYQAFSEILESEARIALINEMNFDDQKLLWYVTEEPTTEAGLRRHFGVDRVTLVHWMDRVIHQAQDILLNMHAV
jgi:DNA-directed RNA polymerase specialized sigma subunit|tara:strand:+ start:3672 stop:4259 length:588 start_codon:yes stop_codon:yes gene_type:complete